MTNPAWGTESTTGKFIASILRSRRQLLDIAVVAIFIGARRDHVLLSVNKK
jgi:hypothetical protein